MHVAMFKLFKNIEITVAQFDLMETVLLSENQALSIQDLASRTTSLQPNITRMVSELENANFVERSGGPDRRTVFCSTDPQRAGSWWLISKNRYWNCMCLNTRR